MTKRYKVLSFKGAPFHGGNGGAWDTPKGKKPGKWLPHIKDIEPCSRGYHTCEGKDLLRWLGPQIWVAEIKGKILNTANKTVSSDIRLIEATRWDEDRARLFMADCLAHTANVVNKDLTKLLAATGLDIHLMKRAVSSIRLFVKDRSNPWGLHHLKRTIDEANMALKKTDRYSTPEDRIRAFQIDKLLKVINWAMAPPVPPLPALVFPKKVALGCRSIISWNWEKGAEKEYQWQTRRLLKYISDESIPRPIYVK